MDKNILHESTRYKNEDIKPKNDRVVEKKLPEIYEKRENCCGCSACYAVCPVGAISMEPDEEGFLYPVVDASQCIRCYKCLTVCAFKKDQLEKGYF
ncbi:MAG: 4Fe-4S dicluster domain-containing protein [Lachnospiraceae bacterium]|nr:4Fe-4S dicluster domain-containing protein [Lachnospiraceae bacterium]